MIMARDEYNYERSTGPLTRKADEMQVVAHKYDTFAPSSPCGISSAIHGDLPYRDCSGSSVNFRRPWPLRNVLTPGTGGEQPTPKLEDRTIEELPLSGNAQRIYVTLDKADEDLGVPHGILNTFFQKRHTTRSTPTREERWCL